MEIDLTFGAEIDQQVFASEAIGRIVDNALQQCDWLGMSADLPIARIYREVRPFRVYDAPSEMHRFSIAKRAVCVTGPQRRTDKQRPARHGRWKDE